MRKALLGLTLAVLLALPTLARAHHRRTVVVAYPAPVVAYAPVVTTVAYPPVVEVTPAPVVVTTPTVYVERPVRTIRYYPATPVVVSGPTVYVYPRR